MVRIFAILAGLSALAPAGAWAQPQTPPVPSACAGTPAYSPCEMVFELSGADASAHPSPYTSVQLRVEFRSPRHRTFAVPGYWDGGGRMVVRFAPVEAGDWDYRVTSNIAAWNDKKGTFAAAASGAPGFIRAANMHHWAYTERSSTGLEVAHLWMGASEPRMAWLDDAGFRTMADARSAQKFNHLRALVMGDSGEAAFTSGDTPNLAFFRRLDERVRYLNGKGIVADLVLAPTPSALARRFPDAAARRRFVQYMVARYAGMNVTWQGAETFEGEFGARAILKEIGLALKEMDPYGHPRTSGAHVTSAPLLDDGWMDFAAYGSSDDSVGAIEHQLYAVPFVNQGIAGPDSAALRRRLWNATMNGQYVTYAGTGAGAGAADASTAKAMTVWFDFMSSTRHWELEPYFDVDGGRAVALDGVEYVVYLEKPGSLELLVEKHGYDIYWVDPSTGQAEKGKKFSGDHFTGAPPDPTHDWVLHVVREGRLESMNRSYIFSSREEPLALQVIENNLQKVPFEVKQPLGDIPASKPTPYAAKITRPTHATRSMLWMWTCEVPSGGQGYRVLATGAEGTFQPPAYLAEKLPAVTILRLYGMNANGKVYSIDKGSQLIP